jgi:hypothetical protein
LGEQSQAKSNKAKMPTTLTNRSILAVNLLEAHHTGFASLSLPNKPFILLTKAQLVTANQLMLWASAHS